MFQDNPQLNSQFVRMIRFVFRKAAGLGLPERSRLLQELCKSFQDCQMVQARTIQSLYDQLLGRNLQRQILALVDKLKVDETGVLRRVVYALHGSNHGAALPHLEAGVVAAIGAVLGLPGTTAAQNDKHRTSCGEAGRHVAKFRELFSVDELLGWLVADINGTGPERIVEHSALDKFAKRLAELGGPARELAYGLFYDEDQPELYESPPRTEAQLEQEAYYLHKRAALGLLEYVFLPEQLVPLSP